MRYLRSTTLYLCYITLLCVSLYIFTYEDVVNIRILAIIIVALLCVILCSFGNQKRFLSVVSLGICSFELTIIGWMPIALFVEELNYKLSMGYSFTNVFIDIFPIVGTLTLFPLALAACNILTILKYKKS